MKSYLAYIFILCSIVSTFGQVGINNPNPAPSSILDLTSYEKGFLVPRMTSQRRTDIPSPANSLMVYDLDEGMYYFYDSTYSGAGNLKWTAINPFVLRDDDSFPQIVVGGKSDGGDTTINFKNIFTNDNVRSIGVGGRLSVGNVDSVAPINGVYIEGQVRMNSSLTVEDTVFASVFKGIGECPVGAIIMWSGGVDATDLPDGWKLCKSGSGSYLDKNGNSHLVPDLSGKFIVGYEETSTLNGITATKVGALKEKNYGAVRNTGGEVAHTLLDIELASHQHEAKGNGANMQIIASGEHTHQYYDYRMNESSNSGDYADGDGTGGHSVERTTIAQTAGHTHSNASFTGLTGNGDNVNDESHENRPPYYVLAYIIRVK